MSSQTLNKNFFFWGLLYAVPILGLIAIAIVSLSSQTSIALLTRDPSTVAGIHPFVGIISNLGVLVWTITATICLFSGFVLRHEDKLKGFAQFMFCAGLITALLMVDDLFLLHDFVFPHYFSINEKKLFLIYGGLVIGWLVKFRRYILRSDYLLLFSAFLLFVLSLLVDLFQYPISAAIGEQRILLEDGFKLLGIVGWFGYFFKSNVDVISDLLNIQKS